MIDDSLNAAVSARLKELLFDKTISQYKNHEMIISNSGSKYQFLFWKLQPLDWEGFSSDLQKLVELEGYKMIPGACDVTTFNPDTKTGYKVVALYKLA
jgi:hypothetical protein